MEAGEPALPWSLLSVEGMEIDFPRIAQGRPALLVFIAPACDGCAPLMEALQRLREDYAGHELEVYVVGSGDAGSTEAVVGPGRDFVLMPEGTAVVAEYGTTAVPALLLIDQRGVITTTEYPVANPAWDAAIRAELDRLVVPD